MLIKAKERKTLVSPAEGVASREMAGLFCPTTRHRRRRHRWRRIGASWESVCRDFYPAGVTSAFTVYRLSVVTRRPALGSRLPLGWAPRPPRSGPSLKLGRLAVGNKKTKAGQGTPRNDCVTEVDGPMQGFRLPARMRGHGAGRGSRVIGLM